MPDSAFELDIAPKKPKVAPVSGWFVTLNIFAFLCLAAILTMMIIEKMYMRGEWESQTALRASEVLLPRPLN